MDSALEPASTVTRPGTWTLTTVVENTIRSGGELPLRGLGKFKVQHRKARIGRNPLTGQPVDIPAKTVVKFTVAKSLKDLIL